jgi:hypothetical protein
MASINDGSNFLKIFDTSRALATTIVDGTGAVVPRVNGAAYAATDAALPIAGLNDGNYRALRTDRLGGLATAATNILFHEPFEGTTVSTPNRLTVATTTFTQAQTVSGGLNLNSGNSNASAAAALVTTNRRFLKLQRAPLQAKIRARLGHVTNAVLEIGFGLPANQTSAPTVGAFWQVTTGGVVQPVLTFNSVDIPGTAVTMPANWQNQFFTWDIILDDDEAVYTVQDTSTGLIIAERRIQLPTTQTRLWDATRLPVYARLHNPSSPATAPTLIVAGIDVVLVDAVCNKPWSHVQAMSGFSGDTVPTTFAQAANYANSAAPSSITLANAGPGATTLGGQFQFAAVAGAETDYVLFGFQVPAPYSFIFTGIDIDVMNTVVAVATTATVLQWFVSPDQLAVTLNAATNRRTTIGMQTFPIGAAAAAMAAPISRDFSSAPLVTNPGRFFVVGLKVPIGTATATEIFRGTVGIRGYFE